jgi:hypothetical protein
MKLNRLLVVAVLAAGCAAVADAQVAEPVANPLPAAPALAPSATLTVEQQKVFLKTARVKGGRETSKGVTRPKRLTLSDGILTHDAAYQVVDERKAVASMQNRTEIDFRDYWGYNIAAHELACLLDRCDLVPAAVERDWDGGHGAMVWWVDDVAMDEMDRVKKKVLPPSPGTWARQMQMMRLFTELTGDTDRNQTNILITKDWRVVLIDFSRGFRKHETPKVERLSAVEPEVLAAMRALTREALEQRAGRWLSDAEIAAVMKRRDAIVTHFDALIAKKGERAVIYPKRSS